MKKSPGKSSSKSKKSSKDRDKKKTSMLSEPSSSSNSCSSIEKFAYPIATENEKTYLGFGPDTIKRISNQYIKEEVKDVVYTNLAEDLTHKVREILQAACINMRHGKRKHLTGDDINAVFKKFQIEPVYGAAAPFVREPEDSIDLLELASSELRITEPGDIGLTYSWLQDDSTYNSQVISDNLDNYCQQIMKAAISNNKKLRMLALKDVSRNVNIGQVIPNFCNFSCMILLKNITLSKLATYALQFLEAIMFNPCTPYSVEENQMTILIFLLLENLLNASNAQFCNVDPICRTLGRLCMNFTRGNQIVIEKIKTDLNADKPHEILSAPTICAMTYISNEALNVVLWPHIEAMFKCLSEMPQSERIHIETAIYSACSLMYRQNTCDWLPKVHESLWEKFGLDLLPIWPFEFHYKPENPINEKPPVNWFSLKLTLLKTMRVLSYKQLAKRPPKFVPTFKCKRKTISVRINGCKNLQIRQFEPKQDVWQTGRRNDENVRVFIGQRTLVCIKKNHTDKTNYKRQIDDRIYYSL